MIIIAGLMVIEPSAIEAAEPAMRAVEAATLAEPGCITYGFWHSHTTPGTYRIYEEWDNEEAIAGHMVSAHMADFLNASAEFGVTSISVDQFEVTDRKKFL